MNTYKFFDDIRKINHLLSSGMVDKAVKKFIPIYRDILWGNHPQVLFVQGRLHVLDWSKYHNDTFRILAERKFSDSIDVCNNSRISDEFLGEPKEVFLRKVYDFLAIVHSKGESAGNKNITSSAVPQDRNVGYTPPLDRGSANHQDNVSIEENAIEKLRKRAYMSKQERYKISTTIK